MRKRMLGVLLVLAVLVSALAMTAVAEDGTYAPNVTDELREWMVETKEGPVTVPVTINGTTENIYVGLAEISTTNQFSPVTGAGMLSSEDQVNYLPLAVGYWRQTDGSYVELKNGEIAAVTEQLTSISLEVYFSGTAQVEPLKYIEISNTDEYHVGLPLERKYAFAAKNEGAWIFKVSVTSGDTTYAAYSRIQREVIKFETL